MGVFVALAVTMFSAVMGSRIKISALGLDVQSSTTLALRIRMLMMILTIFIFVAIFNINHNNRLWGKSVVMDEPSQRLCLNGFMVNRDPPQKHLPPLETLGV